VEGTRLQTLNLLAVLQQPYAQIGVTGERKLFLYLCSREHISYKNHSCPSAYKKDVQVPVCPLCNTPIPVKRGEQPDIAVGAHIDSDCMSDPAKNRRKVTF
jgi:hypothetical protein